MDYKKIIKSRKLRLKILRLLSFVPDTTMVKLQYRVKMGRKLDLKNPKRYTEKIQWYKLYYRDKKMMQCVDKYEVREYIKEIGIGDILNECYGVFNSPDEIDFSRLPNQFVIKDTLGGGGNSVIICKDKSKADLASYRVQMRGWVQTKRIRGGGREWPYYSGKKHRIIIEKYIESNPDNGGLVDYKFFCFNGKPEFIQVIADRRMGMDASVGIYDITFKKMPYNRVGQRLLERDIPKPLNYDEMIRIAKIISEDFPHVRVDLYNQHGKIIFGETTFYPGSGYMQFDPENFDRILGNSFDITETV